MLELSPTCAECAGSFTPAASLGGAGQCQRHNISLKLLHTQAALFLLFQCDLLP